MNIFKNGVFENTLGWCYITLWVGIAWAAKTFDWFLVPAIAFVLFCPFCLGFISGKKWGKG